MLKLLTDENSGEIDLVSLSLDEIARLGAKKLLTQALALEVNEYIERSSSLRDDDGLRQVVRNGRSKERKITTGSGTITVRAPRVNDRRDGNSFCSRILPPYLRKSANVESILPVLYLKGLSGNAFGDALSGLLGDDAGGLSASSISALKKQWYEELDAWRQRPIDEHYVYLWADGVNIKIRIGEDKKLCLLVIVGVTAEGKKEVVAVESGYRESAQAWSMVFKGLFARGLKPPLLIIGDGALGLWSAVDELPEFAATRSQRCWVHKIANVLDKLPKRLQPKAKQLLHDIMNAETRDEAEQSRQMFANSFDDKYPKAVRSLNEGWDELVTFFDFPAQHWMHIRTTNPIESAFATVKLRTKTTKGSGSPQMAEAMALKLLLEAQKRWNKIRGREHLHIMLQGGIYSDGELVETRPTRLAAQA